MRETSRDKGAVSFARQVLGASIDCGDWSFGFGPVSFDSQPAAALEPRNAVLSGRRLLYVFGIKPRTWRVSLTALLGSH